MILYYSLTGNTANAANIIADVLKDELRSARTCMEKGETSLYSETLFVICAPTFYMNVPKEFLSFLRSCNFEGSEEAAVVLTASYSAGNAAAAIKEILREKGLRLLISVAFYPASSKIVGVTYPSAESAEKLNARMQREVTHFAELFAARQPIQATGSSFVGLVGTVLGNAVQLKRSDKAFFATDDCIACGKCVEICPRANVVLENGRPKFLGNCNHCSACVQVCPKACLQYGKRTLTRARRFLDIPDKAAEDKIFDLPKE